MAVAVVTVVSQSFHELNFSIVQVFFQFIIFNMDFFKVVIFCSEGIKGVFIEFQFHD